MDVRTSVTSGIRAVFPATMSTTPTSFYGGYALAMSPVYSAYPYPFCNWYELQHHQPQPQPPSPPENRPPPLPPLPYQYHSPTQFQATPPTNPFFPPPPQPTSPPYQYQYHPYSTFPSHQSTTYPPAPPPYLLHQPLTGDDEATKVQFAIEESVKTWKWSVSQTKEYSVGRSTNPEDEEASVETNGVHFHDECSHFEAARQLFDEIPERKSEAEFQVDEPAARVALSSMHAYNVTPEVQTFQVEFAAQISKLKASLDSLRIDLHAHAKTLLGRSNQFATIQALERVEHSSPKHLRPRRSITWKKRKMKALKFSEMLHRSILAEPSSSGLNVEKVDCGGSKESMIAIGSSSPAPVPSTRALACDGELHESTEALTSKDNTTTHLLRATTNDGVAKKFLPNRSMGENGESLKQQEKEQINDVELLIAWYDSFLNVDTVFDQRPKDTLRTRYVHMSTANALLQKLHKTHGPVFDAHSIYSMTFLVSRVDLGALHCDTALDFLKLIVGLKQLATSHPIGYAEKSWKHIISGIDQTSQNMKGKKDDMSTSMDAKLGVLHARARGVDHGEHTKKYVEKERKSVDEDVRAEVIDVFIAAEMLLGLGTIDFDYERKIRLKGRFGFMGFDSGGDESGAKGAPSSACASEKMPFPTFPLDVFQKRLVFTDGFASQSYEEIMLSLVAITGVPKSKCGKYLLEYHKYFEMGLYNFQAYHVGSNTSRRSISLVKVEGVSDAPNILMGHGEVEGRFICVAQSDTFIVDIEPDEHMKCAGNESNAGIILLDNSNELTVMIDKSIVHNVSMVGESTHILYVADFSRKDFCREMAYQELKEKALSRRKKLSLLMQLGIEVLINKLEGKLVSKGAVL